jgi:hypothetical protein
MEQALAIRSNAEVPQTLDERKAATDLTIQTAIYWAKKLMEVVESCGLSRKMGDKKYLEVEGWQIIAEFSRTKAIPEWTRAWKDENTGEVVGYECRVKLENEAGEVIGAGESSCGLDAFPCKGKSGSEKDKAARSAAQTWAISRALRNKFSFVAKLAGYEPVPAEEMYTHNEPPNAPDALYNPMTGKLKQIPQPAPKVPPRGSQTAKTALGVAILEYCNQDKKGAMEVLEQLAGKKSLKDLTEQQAAVALDRFKKELERKIPVEEFEQIPDFPVPPEPGSQG